MSSRSAAEVKVRGDEAYRKGCFSHARDFYLEAIKLQETVTLRSNVSAAQYELGEYQESIRNSQRVISLAEKGIDPNASPTFQIKNKLRIARSFIALRKLDDALDMLNSLSGYAGIDEKTKTVCMALLGAISHLTGLIPDNRAGAEARLASVPRYRPALSPSMEYYTVGQDAPQSLLGCPQITNPSEEEKRRAKIDYNRLRMHPSEQALKGLSDWKFSALMIGSGDARNLYATLLDMSQQLPAPKLKSERKSHGPKFHFTLVDIHPTSIARNLVVLHTLDELARFPGKHVQTNKRALDLLAMLHFVWSCAMPPRIYRTLMDIIAKIHANPNLEWVVLEPSTIKGIRPTINYWLKEASKKHTVEDITSGVHILDKSGNLAYLQALGLPGNDVSQLQNQAASERDAMISMIAPQMEEKLIAQGERPSEAKKIVEGMMDTGVLETVFENLDIMEGSVNERSLYNELRVLWPPTHLMSEEPPILQEVMNRSRAVYQKPPAEKVNLARKAILRTWLPNITFTSPEWRGSLSHDPFRIASEFFNSQVPKNFKPDDYTASLYDYSVAFFSRAAEGVRKSFQYPSSLMIELIASDGLRAMECIRLSSLGREPEWPILYDRIHLSNVPDYTGGALTTFTVANALLKPHPCACIMFACLLNTGLFENGIGGPFDISMSSYIYTYTGVSLDEVEGAFGVKAETPYSYMANYIAFSRIPTVPREKLLSRQRITRVMEPLNIHAFLLFVKRLADIGYPAHWLADVIERILEDRAVTDAVPATENPVPLRKLREQHPGTKIFLGPYLDEIRTATTLWALLLPFTVCSPCMLSICDIGAFQITFSSVYPDMIILGSERVNALALRLAKSSASVPALSFFRPQPDVIMISTLEWHRQSKTATFWMSKNALAARRSAGFQIELWSLLMTRGVTQPEPLTDVVFLEGYLCFPSIIIRYPASAY
ncbi:uncharacterized protein EI90DRAFT_617795 [Cantharellus anzutake]|uniref:uncharacterized protein n=1 Tax=Cantharellus anzutake TaxID=1750568 RepID=UPI001908576A|nr:uncharacterized protein EI90DRAFT_617795 [Cantharellus anzutake]KAF8333035.1 hypothetical protein EI90DRAFT_617795 [Cantharellus anzutake]